MAIVVAGECGSLEMGAEMGPLHSSGIEECIHRGIIRGTNRRSINAL